MVVVPSRVYELPAPNGAVTVIVPVATAHVGWVTVAVGVAANGLMITVAVPVKSEAIGVQPVASESVDTVYEVVLGKAGTFTNIGLIDPLNA